MWDQGAGHFWTGTTDDGVSINHSPIPEDVQTWAVLVLGKGQGIDYTRGALILLFGAFSEAWYYILQKPFLRRYSGIEASTWALIAATLPMLVFLPGRREIDRVQRLRTFVIDESVIIPVNFCVRGDEHRLFGIIPTDIHLFGTNDPDGT